MQFHCYFTQIFGFSSHFSPPFRFLRSKRKQDLHLMYLSTIQGLVVYWYSSILKRYVPLMNLRMRTVFLVIVHQVIIAHPYDDWISGEHMYFIKVQPSKALQSTGIITYACLTRKILYGTIEVVTTNTA